MLAASAPSVVAALALTGPAVVEWKLDGARIQVHKSSDVPGVVATARSLHPRSLALDGFFFDILHVDGTDLIGEALSVRRDLLATVAPLHRIPSLVTTDAMLTWQTERFPQLELARDQWAVHLRPELVVEIAVDGVQISRRYPGGVARRFARVKRYREDKLASQADTIEGVRALLPARSAV